MATETYVHPDTGEKVEIPEGAVIVRGRDLDEEDKTPEVNDDDILFWRNPPAHTGAKLHPSQKPGYEATFDRYGTTRRVLGTVSDEEEITATDENAQKFLVDKSVLGPLNRPEAITFVLARSPDTPGVPPSLVDGLPIVQDALDKLVGAGLVKQRGKGGTYEVTAAGKTELAN